MPPKKRIRPGRRVPVKLREFMRPVQPDTLLAEIVGKFKLPRTQITKKMWSYIKRHHLQTVHDRRYIKSDEKLKPIFGNRPVVSMFEMIKYINHHVS